MPLADLVKIVRKNIKKEQINALPNGLICLKGGELAHENIAFPEPSDKHGSERPFLKKSFLKLKK